MSVTTLAVLVVAISASTLNAQAQDTTSPACLEANAMLANTIGMSEEEIAYFKSVKAKECKGVSAAEQTKYATVSKTQAEIASLMQMIRDNGIDIDARMDRARRQCQSRFATGPLPENVASREEAIDGCTLTNQQVLYAKAINEMNANRQSTFQREQAAYEARLAELEQQKRARERRIRELEEMERQRQAKIAADRAAAQAEMARWRRAVKLCQEGQHEYCAKPEN